MPIVYYVPPPVEKCSCVAYIRTKRPDLNETWGTPYLYSKKNQGKKEAFVGAVGISKEGPVWHTWYVEWVTETEIGISEQNFSKAPGCPVTRRTLKKDSILIHDFH